MRRGPCVAVRGQGIGDRHSGVDANHSEALVAERLHERDHVVGLRAGVVPARGFVGQPDPALVDRDDLEVPRQRGHHEAPVVPILGPAVHQQQRRAFASDDRVQAHLTSVDVPAGERIGEPRREVRRPRDGAGAFRGRQAGGR